MSQRTIPMVSVIMPAYNAEQYIKGAIDSILNQTYTDFEFIIINDGSIDGTEDIIKSYTDPRIIYIKNETNCGICVTLNKGLDIAQGKYIARMDSDDISDINRFTTQIDFMEAHPEIGISGSDITLFGGKQGTFSMVHEPDLCAAGLIFNPCFAHPTVIWRKRIMDEYNLRYDENYVGLEDFVMWWKFAEVTQLANIPQSLLKYRIHENQETQNISERVFLKSNEFRKYRYEKILGVLSSTELKVLDDYSYGNFHEFSQSEFELFVVLMARIAKCSVYPIKTTRHAVKIVLAKAVGYILNQSPHLTTNRIKFLCKAFIQGALPFSWFLRFFKSYL